MAGKYEGKRAKTRRPWEFKKKLAAWAVLIATATAVASYVLAYLDKQTAMLPPPSLPPASAIW